MMGARLGQIDTTSPLFNSNYRVVQKNNISIFEKALSYWPLSQGYGPKMPSSWPSRKGISALLPLPILTSLGGEDCAS